MTIILESGENNLTIEVANTWSNRLTGDAIKGKNYTNTNITRTIIVLTEVLMPGDQTRVFWAEVPLIESGLSGLVNIIAVKLVN